MITEALAGVFFGFFDFVLGLLPEGDAAPGWLSSGASRLEDLVTEASGLGVWFPWSLSVIVITAVFACVLVGFLIKVVRIVASFLTAGGGSAA